MISKICDTVEPFFWRHPKTQATVVFKEEGDQYNPPHSLCSSSLCRLSVSGFGENTNKKRPGTRSFRNAAPTLWNRQPDKLNWAKDIASFRWQLKLHLFSTLWTPHSLPHIFLPLQSHPIPTLFFFLFFFLIFFAKQFSNLESDFALLVDIDNDIDPRPGVHHMEIRRGRFWKMWSSLLLVSIPQLKLKLFFVVC